jgi:hypothetical protein
MSVISIQQPFPNFTGLDGEPLENGYIFIGEANLNPITNPISVFFDPAFTIPVAQPIRTISGYAANAGVIGRLYVDVDYSIQVQDKNGSVVFNAPAAIDGEGPVTSVNVTGGTTGLTTFGGPVTQVGTITLDGTLNLVNGGTGATTAFDARANLGLGSMATQDEGLVNITGGAITGVTGVALVDDENIFTEKQIINKGFADSELFIGSGTDGIVFNHVTNNLIVGRISLTPSVPKLTFTASGIESNTDNVFKPTAGSWLGISDERLKTNIVDYSQGLAAIKSLRPVNFKFKDEVFFGSTSLAEKTNHKVCTGFIAQEVEKTELANMVIEGSNGYKTLDVSEVTYALVNAVKELSEKLDAAEAEIKLLKK